MRMSYLLVLLVMMTALVIMLGSCSGPPYRGPAYSTYYSYPNDYTVWSRPNFTQPAACSLGRWSSHSISGYFPVEYLPATHNSFYNKVAVLHDNAP